MVANGVSPGCRAAVRPARIAVAVLTDDPLSGDAVTAHVRELPGLTIVPPEQRHQADVVAVVAVEVNERLVTMMLAVQEAATNPNQCAVLVADAVPARFMTRLLAGGVVSVLPRNGTTPAGIAHAVVASAGGRSVLSPVMTRRLVDHCREFERIARTEHGIVPGGLTTREVDVLRLLAEGLSTAEIASRIRYSERTIKAVIQELLARTNLPNRAAAIGYAFSVGAL